MSSFWLRLSDGNEAVSRCAVWVVGTVVGVLTTVAFAYFVWPTPWRYDTEYQQSKLSPRNEIPIRFNRFTGQKQTNMGDGWFDGSVILD